MLAVAISCTHAQHGVWWRLSRILSKYRMMNVFIGIWHPEDPRIHVVAAKLIKCELIDGLIKHLRLNRCQRLQPYHSLTVRWTAVLCDFHMLRVIKKRIKSFIGRPYRPVASKIKWTLISRITEHRADDVDTFEFHFDWFSDWMIHRARHK